MATIGGFQVGPFQPIPAYQQGGAPIIVDDGDGGTGRRPPRVLIEPETGRVIPLARDRRKLAALAVAAIMRYFYD